MNVFKLFAWLGLDKSEYDKGLGEGEKQAKTFGEKLKSGLGTAAKVTATALTTASTAVVAFGAASVKTGAEFDSSMSQVAATMNKTVDEIRDLRDFAIDMGSTTAFSATQAAEGLNILAMAGFEAEQQMAVLPSVLNLAAAGGLNLAQSADYVTGVLAGFSRETLEASTIADTLAKISSSAKGDVQSFGEGLSVVAGMATTTGQKMQDMTVALGILGNNNVAAAEAGNALSRVLKNLYQPTDVAAKAMQKLGVSAYTAEGDARPLQDVLIELNNSLAEMNEQQKNEALAGIFDAATLKTVPALLNNATTAWDDLSRALDNASGSNAEFERATHRLGAAWSAVNMVIDESAQTTSKLGAAEQMAKTQLDNLAGDVTLFKSALEGAQIVISDELTPSIREFVQFGTEGITRLSDAFKEGGLSGAANVFGGILSDGINMIVQALPQVVEAGAELLNGLVTGILSNIGAITQTVITIAVEFAKKISDSLPTLIPAIYDAIIQVAQVLVDNLDILLDAALQIVVALGEGLLQSAPIIYSKLPDIILGIVNFLVDSTPMLVDAGVQLFLSLIENLPLIITELVKAVPKIITGIVSAIGNLSYKLVEAGGNLLKGLWEGIKGSAGWLWDKVKGWLGDLWGGIKDFFGIHSPSRLFRDGLSKNLMLGFAEGISKYGDYGIDAIDEWSRAINGVAQIDDLSMMSDINAIYGGGTYEPITPVVQNIYAQKMTPSQIFAEARDKLEEVEFMGLRPAYGGLNNVRYTDRY